MISQLAWPHWARHSSCECRIAGQCPRTGCVQQGAFLHAFVFGRGGADAQTLVGSDASDSRDAPLCGSVATWLSLRARVR